MSFFTHFSQPPVLEDEYANSILHLRISPKEVFEIINSFILLILCCVNYRIDENGDLHPRPVRYRRMPPALKWGEMPRYWLWK